MSTATDRLPLGRGARVLLIVACVFIIVAGLRSSAEVVAPVLVGVFVAVATLPLFFWLKERGVPHLAAVAAAILVDVAVMVGASYLVATSINSLAASLPVYVDRLVFLWDVELAEILRVRGLRDDVISGLKLSELVDQQAIVSLVQSSLGGIATLLSHTMLVVLIVMFVLWEASLFPKKLQHAFGRLDIQERFGKVVREVRHYLVIKTMIAITKGILLGLLAYLMGVDFAVLWGLVAAIFHYIPNIGSILAAIPACLVALIQLGLGPAVVLAFGYLAVDMVLGNVIEPHIMGRELGLSTLVVFLSLVFWGWMLGPAGMLLSVPLTMIVKIMLENSEDLRPIGLLLGAAPSAPPAPPQPAEASTRTSAG